MPDDEEPERRRGLRFNGDINLGTMIAAILALCGGITFVVTTNNRAENTAHDMAAVQTQMSSQMTDLRSAITAGLEDVRRQIATLPDQRARLDAVERRLGEIDGRLNNNDQRISAMERQTIETRAQVDSLMRTANAPLPTRGTRP